MTNQNKRQPYVPPRIFDLGGSSVEGQEGPLGFCGVGYYPYAACNAGADVDEGSCDGGGSPTGYQCRPFGSGADSVCSGGGYQ